MMKLWDKILEVAYVSVVGVVTVFTLGYLMIVEKSIAAFALTGLITLCWFYKGDEK